MEGDRAKGRGSNRGSLGNGNSGTPRQYEYSDSLWYARSHTGPYVYWQIRVPRSFQHSILPTWTRKILPCSDVQQMVGAGDRQSSRTVTVSNPFLSSGVFQVPAWNLPVATTCGADSAGCVVLIAPWRHAY